MTLPSLPVGGGNPELEKLAVAWIYTHPAENTRRAYWADLGAFTAFCAQRGSAVLGATRDDLEDYRTVAHDTGAGDATVARRLAALASFYRYAHTLEPTIANPTTDMARPPTAPPSRTDILDRHEVDALLRAAKRLGPRPAALVSLLVLDGLKLGEAIAANVKDLSGTARHRSLTITHRDGHVHHVDLDPRTAGAIDHALAGRTSGPLLSDDEPDDNGPPQPLTRFRANYLVKRSALRAHLPRPVSANTLRRTFITAALETGTHLRAVQQRVGHTDRRTTRRLSREPAD